MTVAVVRAATPNGIGAETQRIIRETRGTSRRRCSTTSEALVSDLQERIATRLDEAIAAADNPAIPVSVVVNRAIRVARLRNDWPALVWLLMETRGRNDEQAKNRAGLEIATHLSAGEMASLWRAAVEAFISERALYMQEGMLGMSVAEAEASMAGLREQAGHLHPPAGLEGWTLQQTAQSMAEQRAQLLNAAADTEQVLARVRSRVSDYLSAIEQQIAFGQVSADAWERNRIYVDARLVEVAPNALVQFQAAYRRQSEDDPEARSQALLCCRRVLKSMADAIYPARSEPVMPTDGELHALTDDKFINRLIQFLSEALPATAGEVIQADLASFGTRLDSLNELASKGVHASVTQAEVDLCIVRTYIFAGDLLRVMDGASAALKPLKDATG